MSDITVLLADDHAMVRDGMRSLLEADPEISQVHEASNGQEAVMMMAEHAPDVVVMDYEMPNFDGIYATREIVKAYPGTPVILVSAHNSREHVMDGVQAGIRGFLPKETPVSELIEAIKSLREGGTWFKGKVAELIAPSIVDSYGAGKKQGAGKMNGGLTPREKEVLKAFALGKSARIISEELFISKRTVDVHKSNIFKKLGIKNVAELVRYAVKQGLIKF